MPEWYDAAPPNVEEVAKKEFGNLIEDDPKLPTGAKEGVIEPWAAEESWKSIYNAKSTEYTLSDLAALKESWAKEIYPQWTITVGDGKLPDAETVDFDSWLGTIPSKPWVTYYHSTPEGLKPYSNGWLVLGPPEPVKPLPHQCHCLRDRHLEPLRQKVADMLSRHSFDPTYDASQDDSPIICVGSETYGPNRPPARTIGSYGGFSISVEPDVGPTWTEMVKQAEKAHYAEFIKKENAGWLKALNAANPTYKSLGEEE